MAASYEPTLREETKQFATVIAIVIRNAMEDFHCQHLSDDQMRLLNPIIRNAVATALHAVTNYERFEPARRFVDIQVRCVPKYWEPPQLLDGYVRMSERELGS